MQPPVPPSPGKFDNRWVVFPQDFPSATFLRSRGVADVLLIHSGKSVQEDLAHVLLRWQQGGLRMMQASPSDIVNERAHRDAALLVPPRVVPGDYGRRGSGATMRAASAR